jgi:hypothetical protein
VEAALPVAAEPDLPLPTATKSPDLSRTARSSTPPVVPASIPAGSEVWRTTGGGGGWIYDRSWVVKDDQNQRVEGNRRPAPPPERERGREGLESGVGGGALRFLVAGLRNLGIYIRKM